MTTRSEYLATLRKGGTSLWGLGLNAIRFKLAGKNIRTDFKTKISGLSNIHTLARLEIGTEYVGFVAPFDRTWLKVEGRLEVHGDFTLGRGCRVDVGPKGKLILHGGRITANTTIIAMHHVEIGSGCAIAWGVEFLDADFHSLRYEGQVERDPSIVIGDHVWIGSHAKILKGVRIGNGCVIAANSLVTKSFPGERLLIGGNPARVLRENIDWS